MSNVAGRRDGMVNASDGAEFQVELCTEEKEMEKKKEKKKVKTDRGCRLVESTIDYVYYKNPWPVENSYSPNLVLT